MNTYDGNEAFRGDLLAYIEGSLSSEKKAAVERALETFPECRQEYEALAALCEDLSSLGDSIQSNVPDVDLVDSVMAVVSRAAGGGAPVSLAEARRRRRSVTSMAMGLAAAAAFLVAAGLVWQWGFLDGVTGRQPQVAGGQTTRVSPPVAGPSTEEQDLAAAKDRLASVRERISPFQRPVPAGESYEAVQAVPVDDLTVDDVLAARKAGGEEGWSALRQWATLAPEKAQAIIDTPGMAAAAIVGASRSVSPEAAEQALLTVVGEYAEEPYVRFALAQSQAAQSGAIEDAQDQLSALHTLDSGNALVYYIEARLLLDAGDVRGALAMLEQARSLEQAGAYSLEAAQFREQTLIQSGLTPEAARMVAALTAGMDEYNFLCDLGKDLLEYGQASLDAEDTQTAALIFEAVQRMGVQLEQGATLAQEQLAALDIQRAASEVLAGLYTALESAEGIEALTAQMVQIEESLAGLDGLFAALDSIFSREGTSDFWGMISDIILMRGDLDLTSCLDAMGLGWLFPSSPGAETSGQSIAQ